jgi:hypothetical protein
VVTIDLNGGTWSGYTSDITSKLSAEWKTRTVGELLAEINVDPANWMEPPAVRHGYTQGNWTANMPSSSLITNELVLTANWTRIGNNVTPPPPSDDVYIPVGGGGGGTVTPPAATPAPEAPPEAPPVVEEDVTIGGVDVVVEVEGENAAIDLTEEEVVSIIEAALEDNADAVVIDLSADEFVNVTSVELSGEVWEAVGEANLGLEFNLSTGTLSFDANSTLNIGSLANGAEVVVSIDEVAPVALNPMQQAVVNAVGNSVIMQITLTIDGNYQSNLGGTLQVTVDYDGPLPVFVWRVADDGTLVLLNAWANADGTVTFETNRLSFFVIGTAPATAPVQQRTMVQMTIGATLFSVNGLNRTMDTAPYIVDGRTMVPLRFASEALGASVNWSSSTRTATIALDGIVLSIVPGQLLPGMDVAAELVDGRVMVPVRYVAEALGAEIDRHTQPGVILIVR